MTHLKLVLALLLALPSAAQDTEESVFDDDVCPDGVCLCAGGPANPTLVAPISISSQATAHSVVVSGIDTSRTIDVLWIKDTYDTVVSCYSPTAGKCDKETPNSCSGSTCTMNWDDCWHKDVTERYHLASEAVTDLMAVVSYTTVDPADPTSKCTQTSMMATWYFKVMDFEANKLDKVYVDWASTPTEAQVNAMKPTISTSITGGPTGARTATVSMNRNAAFDVPFLYVRDSQGRVMWMKDFTGDNDMAYTSPSFDIPMVSTDIVACFPDNGVMAVDDDIVEMDGCTTVDLVAAIEASVDGYPSDGSLAATAGTYKYGAFDSYVVTPTEADVEACPTTYILYAENAASATLGMSIGNPLSVIVNSVPPVVSATFKLACPASGMKTLSVDMAAAKAATPPPGDGAVSGEITGDTPPTCGDKAEGSVWSCDSCSSGECQCTDGTSVCYGSPASGDSISSEEAVGIAIAVVIIFIIIVCIAAFCYKKQQMTMSKVPIVETTAPPTSGTGEGTELPPKSEAV